MPFLTQGKTNWKFLLITIILASFVGAGALWYVRKSVLTYQPAEIKKQEEIVKMKLLIGKPIRIRNEGLTKRFPEFILNFKK